MFPPEFIERISLQAYLDQASLLEALGKPAAVSVRINGAKWRCQIADYDAVSWEPSGYYLPSRPQYTFDPLFHAGVYYPQEASGMFTGEVFRQVTAGMSFFRVLDLCGAPGSKSTHLSSIVGDKGYVIANEVIRSRAAILAENITKWGIGNTIVAQNDPSEYQRLEGFFDVMVVDAPCSGEGMFNDHTARNEWSSSNAKLCSERQRRILMDAWPALREGGILIYSTCTFNPAENEENVRWLCDITGSQSLTININTFNGITEIDYHGIKGYGFHPGKIRGDGFFIAAVRKPGEASVHRVRNNEGDLKIPSKILPVVEKTFSFDEKKLLFSENRIFHSAVSREIFVHLSERLNIVKSGTMIGEIKNDDFVPAHDLAMSVRIRRGSWPEYDATYGEALAMLRHDELRLNHAPAGRLLVCYRGVPLGFINNLGRRVNNSYPQAWRIRSRKSDIFEPVL